MLPVQLLRTWWLGRNRHELHRGLRLLRLLRFLSLHTLTLCFMRHGRLPTFVDAGLPPVHLLRARGGFSTALSVAELMHIKGSCLRNDASDLRAEASMPRWDFGVPCATADLGA